MRSHAYLLGAPLAGTVHRLQAVPDPTFAEEMLGPGTAIFPEPAAEVTIVAPAGGLIRTLHAHAFILQLSEYAAILVHLGIDTFRTESVFELLTKEGRYVSPLSPLVRWNLEQTEALGLSPWVTLTALSGKNRAVTVETLPALGEQVSPGQSLLKLCVAGPQAPGA